MWRAFFVAIGISLAILGAEGLLIEKATVRWRRAEPAAATYLQGVPYLGTQPPPATTRDVDFSESFSWFLIAAGSLVVLYSATVAKG